MRFLIGFVSSFLVILGVALSSLYVNFLSRESLDKVVFPLMEATATRVASSVSSELLAYTQLQSTVASLMSRKTSEDVMDLFSGKYDRFLSGTFDMFKPYYLSFGIPSGHYYGLEYDAASPRGRIISFVHNLSTLCFEDFDFSMTDTNNISSYRLKGYCGYNVTTRPWYLGAVAAQSGVWSDPYVFSGTDPAKLGITYASPVYDSKGNLLCVGSTDLVITNFHSIVKKAKADAFQGSKTGYAAIQIFVVHANGDLVKKNASRKFKIFE
jgi:hypothetical protein